MKTAAIYARVSSARQKEEQTIASQTAALREYAVVQFAFPAYAPELNPVEYVWSYLKTKPLANLACPDVGVLASVGRRHARALQHRPRLLRSFFRHSPLPLR